MDIVLARDLGVDVDKDQALEVVLIIQAITDGRIKYAKRVDPKWCLTPKFADIYREIQKFDNDDHAGLMERMMPYTADPVISKYWADASSVHPEDALVKMKQAWRHREELYWFRKYAQAIADKDKLAALAAIKSLYQDTTGEIYIPDYNKPVPVSRRYFEINGTPCLVQGELTAIKGKAKAGKSTFMKILTSAAIGPSGECMGVKRVGEEPLKILYFDTEQSFEDADRMLHSSVKMAGLPDKEPDNLKVINTRMIESPEKRLSILEEELTFGQYDIVMLDGIRDVVWDINDPRESSSTIAKMLALAQERKMAIIAILHENPNKDNDKIRGWLGTECLNKAQMVWQLSMNEKEDRYEISCSDCRRRRPEPIAYRWNDDDEIEAVDMNEGQGQGQNALTKEEKQWNQFVKAWENRIELSLTKEEIIKYHLKAGTLKETTCKNRIKEYLAKKRIKADGATYEVGTRYELSTEERIKLREGAYPIVGANSNIWTMMAEDDKLPF